MICTCVFLKQKVILKYIHHNMLKIITYNLNILVSCPFNICMAVLFTYKCACWNSYISLRHKAKLRFICLAEPRSGLHAVSECTVRHGTHFHWKSITLNLPIFQIRNSSINSVLSFIMRREHKDQSVTSISSSLSQIVYDLQLISQPPPLNGG